METQEQERTTPVVPPGQGGGGNGKEETVSIGKAELDALRRDRDEARESERYWAGVARTGNGNGAPATEDPAGEDELVLDPDEFVDPEAADGTIPDDTPEKLVDEIAGQGVKALQKRGFVTAAEARRIAVDAASKVAQVVVKNERVKSSTDQQLIGQYPDLRNPQSELFKETAKIYREAVAMDPSARKTPAALMLAARAAKQMIDARQPQETEEERRDRIDAQAGHRGGRPDTGRDDMLGDEAKSIIQAMGITEEAYKEEKTKLTGQGRSVRRGR